METKVISINQAPFGWSTNKAYVYIGRPSMLTAGYFGNPIPCRFESERDAVYTKYVAYLKNRLRTDETFKQKVAALSGKTLVCFCAPRKCHGDALKVAADYLASKS